MKNNRWFLFIVLFFFGSCSFEDKKENIKKVRLINEFKDVKVYKVDTLYEEVQISVPKNWLKREFKENGIINYSFNDSVELEFKPNFSIQVFNPKKDYDVYDFANSYVNTIKTKYKIEKIELMKKFKINRFDECIVLFFNFKYKKDILGEITCFYKLNKRMYKVSGLAPMKNEDFFFKCYRVYEKAIWSFDKTNY